MINKIISLLKINYNINLVAGAFIINSVCNYCDMKYIGRTEHSQLINNNIDSNIKVVDNTTYIQYSSDPVNAFLKSAIYSGFFGGSSLILNSFQILNK